MYCRRGVSVFMGVLGSWSAKWLESLPRIQFISFGSSLKLPNGIPAFEMIDWHYASADQCLNKRVMKHVYDMIMGSVVLYCNVNYDREWVVVSVRFPIS